MKLLAALIASGVLAGCSSLFKLQSYDHKFYQLPAAEQSPGGHEHCPLALTVRDGRANPFINSHKIIFSAGTLEQGYYQLASWVEPPPKRISSLLMDELEEAGIFDSVASISDSARTDLELVPEIKAFYHDTKEHPGTAEIVIDFDLLASRSRQLVAHKTFKKSVEAKSYSAEGAVLSLSEGVQQILAETADWLSSSCGVARKTIKAAEPVPEEPVAASSSRAQPKDPIAAVPGTESPDAE